MKITIPELSLVILIGASGAGKSTFARQHFRATEIISSDYCRGLVSDNENDQSATKDAFEVLHYIAAKRLTLAKLTVIDATNVAPENRKPLLQLAKEYHFFAVAIVLNLPEKLCHDRNQSRCDRQFGIHVVKRQSQNLRRSLSSLEREGFRYVYVLSSPEEIEAIEIERQPLWNNRQEECGPFDLIGDVHGCANELELLLQKLGYQLSTENPQTDSFWYSPIYSHPQGRKVVFLGDLVDRGPRIIDTLKLVRNMVSAGTALCVPGNHDIKLLRYLKGNKVKISHGLEKTLTEIESLPEEIRKDAIAQIRQFLENLVSHYVLDGGKLVVAHAGMKQELQGRGSKRVRDFALYGETTGETDEFGLPVRYNWAREYRGTAMVVYGHTPVLEAEWLNNTIDIDTGCVFGGKLTALRYPEKELVSIPALEIYCQPIKPLISDINPLSAQQQDDEILDLADVLGKKLINTRLQKNITIGEKNTTAALEVMSLFAVNPKWLIYLPPTMSPVATSQVADFLEHPTEAFSYYQQQGVSEVVCEEKHMGSRVIVIICKTQAITKERFGVVSDELGICYTRTGRRFFDNSNLEREFLLRINSALTASGFWENFQTNWVCLDCELMPWSAKAQGLLRQQYAAVGSAARHALRDTVEALQQASQRGIDVGHLLTQYQQRSELAEQYVRAYGRYCWTVNSLADFQLAPFHILASEGKVHIHRDHLWHLEEIAKICQTDSELLLATQYQLVNLQDALSQQATIQWWEKLTASGGEGMVVKPRQFIVTKEKGIIQPAVKCRGQEYLRIIYGPEYSLPEHLVRLRQRGLSIKRSLAWREFALGIEALERFIVYAPLRKVHECVFGILALESEPVDPRL